MDLHLEKKNCHQPGLMRSNEEGKPMKRIFAMAAVAALIGAPVLAQDAGQGTMGSDQGTMGTDQAMPSDAMPDAGTAPDTAAPAPDDAAPSPDTAAPAPDAATPDNAAPDTGTAAPGPDTAAPAADEAGNGAATEAKPMHHRRHARRHHRRGMEAAGGSGNDQVKALNTLAAQGYRPTGQMTKQGSGYVVPVTKDGQASTVMVDPQSGQVSAQGGGN
jgi:hypothetical protein